MSHERGFGSFIEAKRKDTIKGIMIAQEAIEGALEIGQGSLIKNTLTSNQRIHETAISYIQALSPHLPEAILVSPPVDDASAHTTNSGGVNISELLEETIPKHVLYFLPKSQEYVDINLGTSPRTSSGDIDPQNPNFMGFESARQNSNVAFVKMEPVPDRKEPWRSTKHELELIELLESHVIPDSVLRDSNNREMQKSIDQERQQLEQTIIETKNYQGIYIKNRVTQLTNTLEEEFVRGSWMLPRSIDLSPNIDEEMKGQTESHFYLLRQRRLVKTVYKKSLFTQKPDIKNAKDVDMKDWYDLAPLIAEKLISTVVPWEMYSDIIRK